MERGVRRDTSQPPHEDPRGKGGGRADHPGAVVPGGLFYVIGRGLRARRRPPHGLAAARGAARGGRAPPRGGAGGAPGHRAPGPAGGGGAGDGAPRRGGGAAGRCRRRRRRRRGRGAAGSGARRGGAAGPGWPHSIIGGGGAPAAEPRAPKAAPKRRGDADEPPDRRRRTSAAAPAEAIPPAAAVAPQIEPPSPQPPKTKGIAIISRYPNSTDDGAKIGNNLIGSTHEGGQGPTGSGNGSTQASRIVHDSTKPAPKRVQPIENSGKPPLQCNEVTSSDDETNTTPPVPKRSSSSANVKAKFNKNKSLNRELAALQQDHDGVS